MPGSVTRIPGGVVVADKDSEVEETPALPLAATLLPRDAGAREVLRRRAAELAQVEQSGETAERVKFLRCRLGPAEWYGIPYRWLDEILHVNGIVAVPGTPTFIAGVINNHAELLTVLDPRYFFHTRACDRGKEARIVVVRGEGLRVGLLVDEIVGNEDYDPLGLDQAIASEGVAKPEYISGIHQGRVTMLDPGKLLSDPDLLVGKRENQESTA